MGGTRLEGQSTAAGNPISRDEFRTDKEDRPADASLV
jgi:hypothetical protein